LSATGSTAAQAISPDVASSATGEPEAVAHPNRPLLLLALGMSITGMAGWASILAFKETPLGNDSLRVGGMAALALALVGLLAGCWVWRRWQQDIIAQRAANAQLNDFHSVMSLTNRLILTRPVPRELFEGVCEACVEAGHTDLAVIDMPDTGEAHRVVADALAGIVVGATPTPCAPTRGPKGCGWSWCQRMP